MQTFINKFSIAMTPDKTEVVLNFFQHIPTIPDENCSDANKELAPNIEPVANLVMTGQCAHFLVDVLSQMLSE